MTYIRRNDTKATDMMWDACLGGGGPWVHCSCGIDHSVDPDREDYDAIGYSEIDGLQFVYGCPGCEERLGKYERWIWNNRNNIRRYLKIRIEREKVWADQEKLLNDLAGI